jgi:hypothetical protein
MEEETSGLYFDAWLRLGEREYICDKYATCKVAI